jgi:hypothetical protein
MYHHNMAYTHLAKLLLGHASENECHAYTTVRLDGIDDVKGTLGPLDLTLSTPD